MVENPFKSSHEPALPPLAQRPIGIGRTIAIDILVAIGTFSAVTCATTFVGIAFESGQDRLMLAGISPATGILAALTLLAARHFGKH